MPSLPSHYHVGMVVPDVDAARTRLTELIGVTWGPILDMDEVPYRDGDGVDVVLPSRICYSTSEPYLEVIQATPGTVWELDEHSNLHHIGFWSGDLVGGTAPPSPGPGAPSSCAGGTATTHLPPSPTTATRCSACASSSSTPTSATP